VNMHTRSSDCAGRLYSCGTVQIRRRLAIGISNNPFAVLAFST